MSGEKKEGSSLWRELSGKRTLRELFRAIPEQIPAKAAAALLCVLTALPLLAAVLIPRDEDLSIWCISLHVLIKNVGYLGIIAAAFSALWDKYNRENRAGGFLFKLRQNGLWIFLLAMLFWSVLSTVFSTNPGVSFFGDSYRKDGLVSYFAYAGIFAAAIKLRNRRHIKLILNIFVSSASVLALLGLLNIPAVNEYLFINPRDSVFCNPNHYGYYICMSIMSAVLLFSSNGADGCGKKKKALFFVIHAAELVLLANALIVCRTLGSLLAVIVALIALAALSFFAVRKRFWHVVIAAVLIFASAGISSVGVWDMKAESTRLLSDISTVYDAISEEQVDEEALNAVGSVRGLFFRNAVKFIGERPVFGYGPDNLGERYRESGITTNDRPHNEVVQFASSIGIPAAVFYLLAMFFHLLMFIKKFRRLDIVTLCAYAAVGAYLVSSLFGNTMFYTTPYYFMLLGISYALIKNLGCESIIADKNSRT